MAVLRNPYTGDDPDPEDDEQDDEHAPSCRCDICTEQRAIYGTDDWAEPESHPESCMCEYCL